MNSPSPQAAGRWAERHAAANDLNGDGVNDYFVGDPLQDTLGVAQAGRVYAMSGADRSVLYSIVSPETQTRSLFGFWLSVLGDVDGDGKDDLAVGTDAQDVTAAGTTCTGSTTGCNSDQGKAWVFSGKHGSVLYALNNPDPQSRARFGSRIGRAGDVNGDGVPESIVGASSNDVPADCGITLPAGCKENQGQAYIFDGKTGALVRRLNLPASDQSPAATCIAFLGCGNFGLSVQSPGDVDGDGVPDQLVDAGNLARKSDGTGGCAGGPGCNNTQGRMYLFSGKTGDLLVAIDDPVPQAGATFGFQDAAPLSPGDVNGDGRADIYGNGFDQDGPSGIKQGRAWVFDGKTSIQSGKGVILYEVKDPTPSKGGQFGWSLAKTDFNKSGPPDLYIGQAPHDVSPRPCEVPPTTTNCGADTSGGTYVFDGQDGSLLKSLELPDGLRQAGGEGELGSDLGWSLAAPGDLNQDGEPDYVAGAPFQNVGGTVDQGLEVVYLSRVPVVPPPVQRGVVPNPGYPVPPPTLAGCAPGRNLITLTSGNDTRNGTPGPDLIFAGAGNDVVDALAGNDCVDLGPGDDRGQGGLGADLVLGGRGADRISGSSGNDRLRGNSGDDRLNGGRGNDRVFGDAGKDTLLGSFGNDVLHGVSGNDKITGSRGRDRINGGSGNDRISGGSSNDRIAGDAGNDRINGNSGRDRIKGNSGNDRIISLDNSRDRVNCGSGRDRVLADHKDIVARNCERVRRR